MTHDEEVRGRVVELLRGGQAHASFEEVVRDFPADLRGAVPSGAPHSAWQLLEHLRIAQRDILDFSRNENGGYRELKWPDEYWPSSAQPPDATAWDRSVGQFQADARVLEELVQDPARDLYRPFPWGDGQTLLREALLAADHNAWHAGQLILLRRMLAT